MQNQKARVLIIDDDEFIRYTIREICQFQGWQVMEAAAYLQAAALLEKDRPDIVIVDYHLPGVDGIRAVKAIRSAYAQLPILVMTVDENEQVMRKFMEAGADDFALKPIKALDLIARVQMHLKYANQRRFFAESPKSINPQTLETILSFFRESEGYIDIDEIIEHTRISQKSIYRYLQYLIGEGVIIKRSDYGKVGRPRASYRLADKKP